MDIAAYQNMRISTRGKRPLRNLTPGDKVRAIQRIHNGETKASVSRDIGVPESTLRGWCKNEQKLRFMCRQLGTAINDPTGLPTNLDNPPEKRTKHVESFDFGHAYPGLNRLGAGRNSINNNSKNDNKNNSNNNTFISNNVINDFMKKNGFGFDLISTSTPTPTPTTTTSTNKQPSSDNGILQTLNSLNGLPTMPNFSQLPPFVQNAHLLSFLNPGLATQNLQQLQQLNATTTAAASNKSIEMPSTKNPLRSSNVATAATSETKEKTKKNQMSSLMVKNWANDALLIPSVNSYKNHINNFHVDKNDINNFHVDKNDTNNNDVRSSTTLSTIHQNDFNNEFPSLFPLGLPLPSVAASTLPTPATLNLDNEARNNAILQWTKVFNASLNFLALTAAAAAVQPTISIPDSSDRHSSANSESSESHYRNNDDYEFGSNPIRRPLASIEHSEDSNFESEPEDLSIRSSTSKLSSPPQTPIQDIMSDSSTLSDNEH